MSSRGHGPPAGLGFRLVETVKELKQLEPAWRELLAASASREPMLDPSWLVPWAQIYKDGRELAVGLFFHRDTLVGMAPLCRRNYRYLPGLTFRRLEFLGSGLDEPDSVCSDYLSIIARRDTAHTVANAFATRLAEGAFGNWDECLLQMMDAANPMLPYLRTALNARGMSFEEKAVSSAPFMTLPPAWEHFLKGLTKKRRQSLHYAMRDFEAWAIATGGEWKLEHAHDATSLERGLSLLSKLNAERWSAAGSAGAFASSRFRSFHAGYASHLLQTGNLDLSWLTVGNKPVAAIYCFRANGKVYFYQSGRIMDVPAKIRLGIVLLMLTLKRAIADRCNEFDFLSGDAHYKGIFADGERTIVAMRVARPSLRETARKTLKGLRDTLSWNRPSGPFRTLAS